jgi:hypothetical protein
MKLSFFLDTKVKIITTIKTKKNEYNKILVVPIFKSTSKSEDNFGIIKKFIEIKIMMIEDKTVMGYMVDF